MKNFVKLGEGLDFSLAKLELLKNENLWNQDNFRKSFDASPFKECDDIILRFNEIFPPIDGEHECINYPVMSILSECRELVYKLLSHVKGERLGRVLISRMKPGAKILPHPDAPLHSAYYERFHIVINGTEGSTFWCGDEKVDMLTGEIWWFQNAIEHSVENNSTEDRIHIVVDIKTPNWN